MCHSLNELFVACCLQSAIGGHWFVKPWQSGFVGCLITYPIGTITRLTVALRSLIDLQTPQRTDDGQFPRLGDRAFGTV
ncbi:hypothetical protein NDI49_03385 [Trichocoleus sp. ST-U3]|nr:hypothetical protein [Coleofasciculus sp. FACHB-542]